MSLAKCAIDDLKRYRRDREINNQEYEIVAPFSHNKLPQHSPNRLTSGDDGLLTTKVAASDLETGHILKLHAGQRVPCDLIFLKTLWNESNGTTFLRTDQLDGETDWKLRRAVNFAQSCDEADLFDRDTLIEIEPPRKEIYQFYGAWTNTDDYGRTVKEGLSLVSKSQTLFTITSRKIHSGQIVWLQRDLFWLWQSSRVLRLGRLYIKRFPAPNSAVSISKLTECRNPSVSFC